ncbi:MAG TPA: hypothetical protein VEB20_03255, partial [Azospirillaceae bacterium]|nr:hypothetical protein [Azospirillaceae bacterium]
IWDQFWTDVLAELNSFVGSSIQTTAEAAATAAAGSATQAAASAQSAVAVSGLSSLTASAGAIHAAAPVAVFVYDTTRDSDGGAWRKRCADKSWATETLGTATRGSRAEFPALALIVATTAGLTIYDADQSTPTLWMSFTANASFAYVFTASTQVPAGLFARDGKVWVAVSGASGALLEFDFLKDLTRFFTNSNVRDSDQNLANRNVSRNLINAQASGALVDRSVNAVTATVLPGSPIDPATGLPRPTVAVVCSTGISVIHQDGRVVNLTGTSSGQKAAFDNAGQLWLSVNGVACYGPIPHTTTTVTAWLTKRFETNAGTFPRLPDFDSRNGLVLMGNGTVAFANFGSALSLLANDFGNPGNGMVATITASGGAVYGGGAYNSGWQPGDIRGCWLSSTSTAALTNGGTVPDRSYKANDLTAVGGLTQAAVATGADLTAVSGFSASNYLERAYDADFDFGTGVLLAPFWVKSAGNSAVETLVERAYYTGGTYSGAGFRVFLTSGGNVSFAVTDDAFATTDTVTSTQVVDDGAWHLVEPYSTGAKIGLRIDGKSAATEVTISNAAGGLTNTSAILRVGLRVDGTLPATSASLCLLRLSAATMLPEQSERRFTDERPLFQAGAKAVLAGSAAGVDALAYDPDTQQLYASQSTGTSVFRGLTRVATISAVGTSNDHNAVSAALGGYVIGTATQGIAGNPALTLREGLLAKRPAVNWNLMQRDLRFSFATTDATATDVAKVPVLEGEAGRIRVELVAGQYGAAGTEQVMHVREAAYSWPVGGTLAINAATDSETEQRNGTTDVEATSTVATLIEADTTARTLDVNWTGKAGTRMAGRVRISMVRSNPEAYEVAA